jgi:predicted transcriptional regulator
VKKTVLLYGLVAGLLIALLRVVEYRYLVITHSFEIYGGILAVLAAGRSNREIAEGLFVSENTVKTHAANLFEKLQARRRTQAVQLAKEAGLIP